MILCNGGQRKFAYKCYYVYTQQQWLYENLTIFTSSMYKCMLNFILIFVFIDDFQINALSYKFHASLTMLILLHHRKKWLFDVIIYTYWSWVYQCKSTTFIKKDLRLVFIFCYCIWFLHSFIFPYISNITMLNMYVIMSNNMSIAINIKKEMWYDCQWDNCPQETKMTQTLTFIGHGTAFNNEQSPYRIVSYKRPDMTM